MSRQAPAQPSAHIVPFDAHSSTWQPLGISEVALDGGFAGDLQELNASVLIAHCDMWLERAGWLPNFDAAVTGGLPDKRRGREFSDSEVYKLLEAMAWEFGRLHDEQLRARFEGIVARVAAAQEADGYLNTAFGRQGQAERWSDLEWGHELYCAGHLIQAAVACGRTMGVGHPLVVVATRLADLICTEFGQGARGGVCGHPEVETALVEFSRLTGDSRYLGQARLFVERRGRGVLGAIEFGADYFQDDVPVRETESLRGHAVRAVYLAAGAVDIALEDGDDELLQAVRQQTLSALAKRTYITGGMGSRHWGEAFGLDFELPSDGAYSETCAGVGSMMLNQRLLMAQGDVRHADAVERVFYNVVATSPAADGHGFFYCNTLHQREPGEEVSADEMSPRAAASLRAPWFAVACCPSNVARTVASLGAYVASKSDHALQLHQHVNGRISTEVPGVGIVSLRVDTAYPNDGEIVVTVLDTPEAEWTLSMRVPQWTTDAQLDSGDGPISVEPGYVHVTKAFAAGDTVRLSLPMQARWTWSDKRVDATRGQVAVERGPIVWCLESVDLGSSVNTVAVDTSVPPGDRDGQVSVKVTVEEPPASDWPYASESSEGRTSSAQLVEVPLQPYHSWGNRGVTTMRVWMPELR